MPKIIAVTKTKAAVFTKRPGDLLEDGKVAKGVIDDVRFTFSFTFDGDFNGKTTLDLNCFISYKKHLASSYKGFSDYKPTSARTGDANTIVAVELTEFLNAFDEYGTTLAAFLLNKDTTGLNPSLCPVSATAEGVFFTNNNDQFHKPFHCFTTLPGGTLSNKTVNLTGRELQDFTNLMKFLSLEGIYISETALTNGTKLAAAKRVFEQYRNLPWFAILVSPLEWEKLRKLVTDGTAENIALKERHKNKRDYEGYIKREENEFDAFMGRIADDGF